MDYVRQEPMAAAQLRAPLYEDKVVDYIFSKAEITDRAVTREELEASIEAEDGHVHGPGCGHDHHGHDHAQAAEPAPAKKAKSRKAEAPADQAEAEAEPAKKPGKKAKPEAAPEAPAAAAGDSCRPPRSPQEEDATPRRISLYEPPDPSLILSLSKDCPSSFNRSR
jgi:trigger factor